MSNRLLYTGNHLFHFTSFESALKIVVSNSLKFGKFENMNDIAEIKKEIYGMIPEVIIQKQLRQYHCLSMTLDNASIRGFFIDSLWGHYAQKGNGVCLVFDKEIMESRLKKKFGNRVIVKPIVYQQDFTNALFVGGETKEEAIDYLQNKIEDIMFTKSLDWKYEKEYRILVKSSKHEVLFHYGKNCLLFAILCLPKVNDYKESIEYKVLKAVLPNMPILRYTTRLGNKELLNEEGEQMCNIIGVDLQLILD